MCFISSRALPCIRLRAGFPPVEVTPPWVTSSDLSSCNSEHNYTDRRPRPSSKVGSAVPAPRSPSSGACWTHQTRPARGHRSPRALPCCSPSLPTSLSCLSLQARSLTVNRACAFLSQGKHAHTEGDIGRGNFASDISGTDPVMPKEWGAWSEAGGSGGGRRSGVVVLLCLFAFVLFPFLLPYVFRDIPWQNYWSAFSHIILPTPLLCHYCPHFIDEKSWGSKERINIPLPDK